MDPLQLVGIVGISVTVGFVAAQQSYARRLKNLQAAVFSNNAESITRITQAALGTLVEDFKIDEADASKKFFSRCESLGMRMVRIDTQIGKSEAITNPGEKPKP